MNLRHTHTYNAQPSITATVCFPILYHQLRSEMLPLLQGKAQAPKMTDVESQTELPSTATAAKNYIQNANSTSP